MKIGMKRFYGLVLAVLVAVACIGQTAFAARSTDVSSPSSGCSIVGVKGTYEYQKKSRILARINQIRKEACDKKYINPSSGEKLKSSDYVPIKWSTALEWTAMLRAAEATVYEDHTRPNGKICFTVTYKGQDPTQGAGAENLAWNYSGMMAGIEQWYNEKDDWVKQNSNAVTGHYESLINPRYEYVGIGAFTKSSGGFTAVAGEFGSAVVGGQSQLKKVGTTTQQIEVLNSKLGGYKISGASSVAKGKTKKYQVVRTVSFQGFFGTTKTDGIYLGTVSWKSSNKSVAKIDSTGKLTAKKKGTAKITAKISGKTISKTVKVKETLI